MSSFVARSIGGGSGRKACLYVGTVASVVGFAIGGTVRSIRGMYLASIPGALFQQNFSVLKALLADYHDAIDEARARRKKQENDGSRRRRRRPPPPPTRNNRKSDHGGSSASNRAGSVGKLGMSVGLAFMVGPLAGSTVIESYDGAVKAAVLFAIASGFFVAKLPKANKSGD